MSTAKAITGALASKGIERSAPGAIYCVLMDGPRSVCMTEAMLDTWFLNLSPEQKAEICEHHHDGPTEVDTTVAFHTGGIVPAGEITHYFGDHRSFCPPPIQLKGGIAEFLQREEMRSAAIVSIAADVAQQLLANYESQHQGEVERG